MHILVPTQHNLTSGEMEEIEMMLKTHTHT
jgi:hypothetical protein